MVLSVIGIVSGVFLVFFGSLLWLYFAAKLVALGILQAIEFMDSYGSVSK